MKQKQFLLILGLVSSLLLTGGCSNDDEPKPIVDNEQTTIPNTVSPQAVDLGLPSGTKWCDRNVGASSPQDNGGYFAWGETVEKKNYSLNNYAYFKTLPYSENGWISIGNDISGTEYDVAHVRMGAPWHMPTVEQIEELYEYCTVEWLGKGIRLTGPNGGQIFLPMAGYRYNGETLEAESNGEYWSGSLYPNSNGSDAYKLFFGQFDPNEFDPPYEPPFSLDYHDCYTYNEGRCYGLSVRAVCQ